MENFETMVGNPVCLQLPWSKDKDSERRWLTGTTGYPLVDAAMKQLQQEGFIHHYLRWEWGCVGAGSGSLYTTGVAYYCV